MTPRLVAYGGKSPELGLPLDREILRLRLSTDQRAADPRALVYESQPLCEGTSMARFCAPATVRACLVAFHSSSLARRAAATQSSHISSLGSE